jgi:hypothetical protein
MLKKRKNMAKPFDGGFLGNGADRWVERIDNERKEGKTYDGKTRYFVFQVESALGDLNLLNGLTEEERKYLKRILANRIELCCNQIKDDVDFSSWEKEYNIPPENKIIINKMIDRYGFDDDIPIVEITLDIIKELTDMGMLLKEKE